MVPKPNGNSASTVPGWYSDQHSALWAGSSKVLFSSDVCGWLCFMHRGLVDRSYPQLGCPEWLTVPTLSWDVQSTQSLPCVFRFTDSQGKDADLGFVVV